ncbi:unnamed protein product [Pelagomonas calceolata]|uniref:RING-CH-type domain-containing protein n=2 Tax=Pelagomonas calceolata TaxID=35677 RepID=A0A8J2SQM4_9STRA|nr:unnamed protein product [Pelagomonas calceolata]
MAELVAEVPPLLRADQAEQHYASAVRTAVAACAADTAGQTCFICMDGNDEEGLVRGCACRGAAGVAHVSCLARQAQVAVERAHRGWMRWDTCGLCEQKYHGVVACALGWACWKTYLGRPEDDWARGSAMTLLANGLSAAEHHEDALLVYEAELSMLRRNGAPEDRHAIRHAILAVQGNLANTYQALKRHEEALRMRRDVYSGYLKLHGEENEHTLISASNYAASVLRVKRLEEAKSVLRKTMPVARRVLGENDETTLRMRWYYAEALYKDNGATLDDLREAVTTMEEIERTARRVFGGANPVTVGIERRLRKARATLAARETPSPGSA